MDAVNQKNNNTKLSMVLSTKLSIDEYNAFLTLTKLEYEAGLIKEESTSEVLRFTIRHILNQVYNQPEYLILKQEQQKQVHQQQEIHNQYGLQPATTAGHCPAPKLYQTSNLQTPKPSSISLLLTKSNVPYDIINLSNDYSQIKVLESAHRQSGKRK
jgi:hypothetical protein